MDFGATAAVDLLFKVGSAIYQQLITLSKTKTECMTLCDTMAVHLSIIRVLRDDCSPHLQELYEHLLNSLAGAFGCTFHVLAHNSIVAFLKAELDLNQLASALRTQQDLMDRVLKLKDVLPHWGYTYIIRYDTAAVEFWRTVSKADSLNAEYTTFFQALSNAWSGYGYMSSDQDILRDIMHVEGDAVSLHNFHTLLRLFGPWTDAADNFVSLASFCRDTSSALIAKPDAPDSPVALLRYSDIGGLTLSKGKKNYRILRGKDQKFPYLYCGERLDASRRNQLLHYFKATDLKVKAPKKASSSSSSSPAPKKASSSSSSSPASTWRGEYDFYALEGGKAVGSHDPDLVAFLQSWLSSHKMVLKNNIFTESRTYDAFN